MAAAPDLSRFRCRRCGACWREFPFSWRNHDSFRTCPGLRALAEDAGFEPHAESAEPAEPESRAEFAEPAE